MPKLKIVAPSTAYDAPSDIPEEDFTVPIGKAAIRREGSQMTILAWLLMVYKPLAAADTLAKQGTDAEVIDLKSLGPIDWDLIDQSIKKTGRTVVVEEGPLTGGVAAELAAGIAERFSGDLKGPVIRVASPDIPVSFAPIYEDAYRPEPKRIYRRWSN